MLELLRIQPHLAPHHPQMPPPTLKAVITVIILPTLTNEPDARLMGTETHGPSGGRVTFSNQNSTRYTSVVRTSRVGSLTFNNESNSELDSHADTSVQGKHAHIFMDHGKAVNIVGYDKSKGILANNMKTVSGAPAYDNPISGKTVIIVIHQAIYVPTMDCNLICPMQVRMNEA